MLRNKTKTTEAGVISESETYCVVLAIATDHMTCEGSDGEEARVLLGQGLKHKTTTNGNRHTVNKSISELVK